MIMTFTVGSVPQDVAITRPFVNFGRVSEGSAPIFVQIGPPLTVTIKPKTYLRGTT